MLKVLELFGGIGACTKALKKLGINYKVVDYVEIDKYAVKSYNAINNTKFEPQDICKWDKNIDVDLIMHGSPCQDFSLAGKQAGGDKDSGTRSSLMYETIRIVEKLKPKYVIWENVKNILSKKHRHNFDSYLERMNQLGYTNYYQVLNAKDYGIPQNRERVFTVSILGKESYEFPEGDKCENSIKVVGNYMPSGHDASRIVDENGLAPTIKENHGTVTAVLQSFEFPPKQELKLKLKDMLEDEVDEKYYLSEEKIERISKWNCYEKPFKKVYGNNSILDTITTRSGAECGGLKVYSFCLDDTTNLQQECLNIKCGAYARNYGSKGKIQSKDYCDTLTASMGTGGGNVPIIEQSQQRILIKNATKKGYLVATEGDGINICGRMKYQRGNVQKDSIQTLTTNGGNERGVVIKSKCKRLHQLVEKTEFEEGKVLNMDLYNQTTNEYISQCLTEPHHNSQRLFDGLRIRKLTPCETWLLMGFDKSDYEKASKVNSNTQLYKQAGNSIVVNVLESIFNELFKGTKYYDFK